MEVLTHPEAFRAEGSRGPVWATLGTFDGLHRGHQHLIKRLIEQARATPPLDPNDPETRAKSLVVTFEIHPRTILGGHQPRPLTTIEHKLRLLAQLGVDACLVLHFDDVLASIEPETFIEEWLVGQLRVDIKGGGVLLGYNNRFGRLGRGDFSLLSREATRLGFTAVAGDPMYAADGHPISSSTVRKAIDEGDLERAAMLLGRPYSVFGRVVRGLARGRTIGFPTANMNIGPELMPPLGVYGVRVREDNDRLADAGDLAQAGDNDPASPGYATAHRPSSRTSTRLIALTEAPVLKAPAYGIANVGFRPTVVDGQPEPLCEAHILDFNGDLYDRLLEIEFLTRIRAEKKFATVDALREQIAADDRGFRGMIAAGRFGK